MARELIVFVPGLGRVSRATQLSDFVAGLTASSERMVLDEVTGDEVPRGARRLRGNRSGFPVDIDVQEAYWNDLVPSLTQSALTTRIARGLSLFWFWAPLALWRGVWKNKFLAFGLGLSAVAFILWYLATLVLLVEAVANDPPAAVAGVVRVLEGGADMVGGWLFWLGATGLVAVLPVALLVDMSDFAKRYAANEAVERGRPAVRFEILNHVRDQTLSALEKEDYASLTVVAHSFGTVVAVDMMADLPAPGVPVRVVTLGSPVGILARRAAWLREDVDALANRPDLVEWVDVNSKADWFASGAGAPRSARCREVFVRPPGTWLDRFTARVHSRYFDNQGAVGVILGTSN